MEQNDCGEDAYGITCITQASQGISEDCYAPLVESVVSSQGQKFYCAMVAQMQTIAPGASPRPDASEPGPSTASGKTSSAHIAGWVIGGMLIVASFFIVAFVAWQVRRWHSRKVHERHNDADEQEEIEWVRTNSHNPRYSTRAWTSETQDTGDGVWKNIGVGVNLTSRKISDDFTIS